MNKNSSIYIAGHTGLVGSALHRRLKADGYSNLIVRNHSDLDLTRQADVEVFFHTERPEYVFLSAAKVGGILANSNYPAEFIHQNLAIQTNVIHEAWRSGVKRLLFLGSSCIYPRKCPQPMKEEYLLTGPLESTNEPYAVAKIAGIKMCESYNLQYGTNFISVMPTNLYGPNDNYDLEKSHVLPAMIRKMHLGKCLMNNDWDGIRADLNKLPIEGVDGKSSEGDIIGILTKYGIQLANHQSPITEITLWGSGSPRREFLYSDDLADACVFLLENINFTDLKNNNKVIRNTHINIGTGKDISIKELAELVSGIVGFDGEICWDDTKPDGTPQKLLDVSKLTSLGWQEKIELEEGIRKVYSNYTRI